MFQLLVPARWRTIQYVCWISFVCILFWREINGSIHDDPANDSILTVDQTNNHNEEQQQEQLYHNAFGDEWAAKYLSSSPSPLSNPPLSRIIHICIIVKGEEFAYQRTPAFVRSLYSSSRSQPIHLHVLGDEEGVKAFREVYRLHKEQLNLPKFADDNIDFIDLNTLEEITKYVSQSIHPHCNARGYGYLFYKFVFPYFIPTANHLIYLDADVIVLQDIAHLWNQFQHFGPSHMVSLAPDQSDGYYYRLQNPADEAIYSPGWRNVPYKVGVNGGVTLLHAARIRETSFAEEIAKLSHEGVTLSALGQLSYFCFLAEQDTIILAAMRQPAILKKLDCRYNYMATDVAGHQMISENDDMQNNHMDDGREKHPKFAILTLFDSCSTTQQNDDDGSTKVDELFQCSCGGKIHILHYAGATQYNDKNIQVKNAILSMSGNELLESAKHRREFDSQQYLAKISKDTMKNENEL